VGGVQARAPGVPQECQVIDDRSWIRVDWDEGVARN
jgi:hypothetical protein